MKRRVPYRLFVLIAATLLTAAASMSMAHATEWSEEIPVDLVTVRKTQYRYRLMETMEFDTPSLDGWTLYRENPGPWGNWISSGTVPVTASDDREVRPVYHAAVTQVSGYSYRRYRYYNTVKKSWYLTYVDNSGQSYSSQGYWQYKTVPVSGRLPAYNVYNGYQAYGKTGDFWFFETEEVSTVSVAYTEYQYRERSRTYTLSRWLPWSDWQDAPVTASWDRDVETRTLYAPDSDFLPSTVFVGSVPELPMKPGTACQLRLASGGNNLVWSSSDPDVAHVDQSGYVSAYRPGTAVVTVEDASIRVTVKDWRGLELPEDLKMVEPFAFEGTAFEYADLKNAERVGEGAFSLCSGLRFVCADHPDIDPSAFSGCGGVVVAAKRRMAGLAAPYYVVGNAKPYIPVTGIALDSTALSVPVGCAMPLGAVISPVDATNQIITWISSDPTVASVSNEGTVRGITQGTAVVSARASG